MFKQIQLILMDYLHWQYTNNDLIREYRDVYTSPQCSKDFHSSNAA